MSIEGHVDLLENFEFSAAVLARRLRSALDTGSEHVDIPLGVLRKAQTLFPAARVGLTENPAITDFFLQPIATAHMVLELLAELGCHTR